MSTESLEQALSEEPNFDYIDESEPEGDKYDDFRWALYDWDKFNPKEYGYNVIRLMGDPNNNRRKSKYSGKYFTIVKRSTYPFIMRERRYWYPLVEHRRGEHGEMLDTIKRITAHYNEGSSRESRGVIYLHRLIAGIEGIEVGDHINGYSLDNRDCNLRPLSVALNNHNLQHARLVSPELLPGVSWRSRDHSRVGGVLRVNGVKTFSDMTWPFEEQEEAWKWVAKQKIKLFGLKKTANGPITVPLPKFPPRLRRPFSVQLPDELVDDIPF